MGFQPTRSAADGPVAMIVRHTRGGGRSGSASIASDGLAQNIERALIDGQIDEFRYADADENGLLSSQEAFDASAGAMTIDEAVAFVARADVNNDTFIDLEEWLPTDLAPVWTGDVDELDARETRAWLADSGFDTDGDGRLSEREFEAVRAFRLPSDPRARAFGEMDEDGDGYVDAHELPVLFDGGERLEEHGMAEGVGEADAVLVAPADTAEPAATAPEAPAAPAEPAAPADVAEPADGAAEPAGGTAEPAGAQSAPSDGAALLSAAPGDGAAEASSGAARLPLTPP
ncbi:hypothetical protein KFE25_005510 [Diacronema lutheri]|uniref:EF-hand domain-containing protein n=1 Tax=Diacronema lutheri TaxID=2081491 RepID=A0A8J5XV20_DIALT|nr:hypothetical protein KFE25_005510 [Diacronema lutheri]